MTEIRLVTAVHAFRGESQATDGVLSQSCADKQPRTDADRGSCTFRHAATNC